jgi:pimeloyl-ACP methyl ester carboxylesterase
MRDVCYVSQRLKLHAVEWGDPARPPLLLLHGARDHARSWDDVARVFQDQWRVIALDLRGHGDSEWSSDGSYTPLAYLCDLVEVAVALGRVSIIAHSMSAQIALRFAALYPAQVRRLVAIEPFNLLSDDGEPPPLADRLRDWIEQKRAIGSRSPRDYSSMGAAQRRLRAENPGLSIARAQHLTRHGLLPTPDGGYRWKFDPCVNLWDRVDIPPGERRAMMAALTCPTLIIYGANSAMTPSERRVDVTGAETLVIAGASHWPHHERFADFVSAAAAFLTRADRGNAPPA